jgi:preprotein translocase subunit YajC
MFFFLQQAPGPLGNMSSFLFPAAILLVFWLFFIRPQAKKQKQQKLFIDELKKGDKVITISGIHGTINKINEDGTISLEINPGSYIKMEKSAVSLEMTQQLNKAAAAPTTTAVK